MRSAILTLTLVLTIAGGAAVGIQETLPPDRNNPLAAPSATADATREKRTNSKQDATSEDDSHRLPPKTVTVNTATDNVIFAFCRARATRIQVTLVSDERYNVTIDPSLPMDSVTIVDAISGRILDTFPMYSDGLQPR